MKKSTNGNNASFGIKPGNNSTPIETPPEKDWTRGPILRNLLLLSWPMVVMESLYVVSQVVDMIWVGKLGSAAIAGVGIANILLLFLMSIDYGFIVGVRAMIARHVGSNDKAGANHVAGQAYILALLWGVLMTVAGIWLAALVMSLFGLESAVVTEAVAYLRVMFMGWVSLEILVMGLYVIQSSGDTFTPMMIELCIRVVHVILCPFLVLGLWEFPKLGVKGAAWSNVVSQIIGAIAGLYILFTGKTRLKVTLNHFYFDTNVILRILKIGVPALLMSLQRSLGSLILTWVVIPFGTIAIGAHSIISRVEMFLYMPAMGLGSGAGVLVGQNLGAGKPERAEKGAWVAVGFVEIFMMICSAALLLWPQVIIGLFTKDDKLIELCAVFLRISVSGYLLMAFLSVLQSSIAGAGDSVPNMIISLGMIWLIQLPLALFLTKIQDLGVLGVRWAIVASTLAGAVAYIAYFKIGRWKTVQV